MGVVQTTSSDGIVGFDDSNLPLAFWLKQTPQTEAGPPVRDLTLSAWVGHETASDGGADLEAVHRLMNEVRRRVDYVIGATSVTTTADEAVIRGAGVCQDHAHVFIAALDPSEFLQGTSAATFGRAITKWRLRATLGPRRGSTTWVGLGSTPRTMCVPLRRTYVSRSDWTTSTPPRSRGPTRRSGERRDGRNRPGGSGQSGR